MATIEDSMREALVKLREGKERKFDQTLDLVINLQKFELKKTPLNLFIQVPHKIKDKKVCGFLEASNSKVDTVLKNDFKKYTDKKKVKQLVDKYDFFIAQASVMPAVASTFGRALGPTGKMPSPQLGILVNADDKALDDLLQKINTSIKIRTKEASIKVAVGKQSMSDSELVENAATIYHAIEKALPRDKDNIKNVELKFTMTKPEKIHLR